MSHEDDAHSRHHHDHDDHHHAASPDTRLRVKATESLLVEKGLADPAILDALIDTCDNEVGPDNGGEPVLLALEGHGGR